METLQSMKNMLSFESRTRVSLVRQLDSERSARAQQFCLHNTEKSLDNIEGFLSEKNYEFSRLGPQELLVKPNEKEFQTQFEFEYSSVWDD